jgi:hypothetical protein
MKINKVSYQQKGEYYHLLFYTDLQSDPFWRSSGQTSEKAARKERKRLEAELRKELAEKAVSTGAEPEGPPGSILALLVAIMLLIGAKWEENTRSNYERAKRVIVEGLGKRVFLRPDEVDDLDWSKVRENLDNEVKDGSRRNVAGMVRRLTKELTLRGLPQECMHRLSNVAGKSQNEASGLPFEATHIRRMRDRLRTGEESTLIRGLTLIGLSAGPQMIDTATLESAEIDLETGRVRRKRIKKKDAIVEFMLLPEALQWVRERYRPGDIYVFPELVFKQSELKKTDCNKNRVDLDQSRKNRISREGSELFSGFLERAGIVGEDYSYKSFRQHVVSFLSSLGVKEKLRMRMVGHQISYSHARYDFPAQWEFCRVRDILERNLNAIDGGREVRYILSLSEVVDSLEASMRAEFAQAEARAQARHTEDVILHEANRKRLVALESMTSMLMDTVDRLCSILHLQVHLDLESSEDCKPLDYLFDAARPQATAEPSIHQSSPEDFQPAPDDGTWRN